MSGNSEHNRIATLTGDLAPLAECVSRYTRFGVAKDGSAVVVAPMPWEAPRARAFWLFEPLLPEHLGSIACPSFYREILFQINGCFAFGLSLYGLPTTHSLLERSTLRPLSLQAANADWIKEFKGAAGSFHFGGSALSDSENVGYFYDNGQIVALRTNGVELQRWTVFTEFLRDELRRAEQLSLSFPSAVEAWRGA